MNNNLEQIKIKAKLESNRLLLFAIWLILVILPYIGLNEVSEIFLSESEKKILLKSKSQIIEEIYDYQKKLTTDYYLEHKLRNFPNLEASSANFSADSLSHSLNRHLKSDVTALFYFNDKKVDLDAFIRPDLKSELGMYSRRIIKVYMEHLSGKAIHDKNQIERATSYFPQLLLAAGGIRMLPEHATPILSGKSLLQKMTAYYKTFRTVDNTQHYLLFLVRNQDVPFNEIIKTANWETPDNQYRRSIVYMPVESLNLYKYISDPQLGLSIYAMPSEEMIIRYITNDTYYPFNLDKWKKNLPILKITAPASILQHPMRDTVNSLKNPLLILVLLISFALIKIAIFGYAGSIRILSRVIICISVAVLIPFASFGLAAFYNHYYTEEYNKNEIHQYTQIQLSFIDKAISSFINNRELSVSELRNNITNLSLNEIDIKLKEWLPNSNASLVSYLDRNTLSNRTLPEGVSLTELAADAQKLSNYELQTAFDDLDLASLNAYEDLERKFNFSPEGMGKIIVNIGKIYPSIPSEPNTLYSVFPVFKTENGKPLPLTVLIVKYDTHQLLEQLKKRMPTILTGRRMGQYSIKSAIIPLTEEGLIPPKNQILMTENFPLEKVLEKINQIADSKSGKDWETADTISSGLYINKINSVIISVAELTTNKPSTMSIDLKKIMIYMVLLISALSLVLGGIIITPLKQLKNAAEKVGQGEYDNKVEWKSRDEFETLSNSFNEMTDALLQKEKMTNYVSQDVLNEISNSDLQLQPGGERIPVSILFCAVKGEKELSQYPVETITTVISKIVDTIDELATDNNGQIDKLIEDTVMVVFRKNSNSDDLAINACRTALAINARLKKELPGFRLIMGIASGDAVSGKIGSRNGKLDYTVIGNPVNLAARLKVQATKAQNTGILVCPYTIRLLQGAARLQFIERLTIKGRTNRTFPLYELLALR